MRIATALRSKTSYCRICGHKFEKGEQFFKLEGTHRVMRSLMCISHFRTKSCYSCPDRLKCLTDNGKKICILGGDITTKAEEFHHG